MPWDREQRSGWLMGLLGLTVVVAVGGGAVYMNKTAERFVHQSEQRDCQTLAADIEAYAEAPPATAAGLNQWRSKAQRYAEIGCEPAVVSTPPPAQPTRRPR